MMDMKKAVNLILKKLAYQVGDSGEERLMFSIVDKAIWDSCMPISMRMNKKSGMMYDTNEYHRRSAELYLEGDMPHAVIIGLDPDYVREVIKSVLNQVKLNEGIKE